MREQMISSGLEAGIGELQVKVQKWFRSRNRRSFIRGQLEFGALFVFFIPPAAGILVSSLNGAMWQAWESVHSNVFNSRRPRTCVHLITGIFFFGRFTRSALVASSPCSKCLSETSC